MWTKMSKPSQQPCASVTSYGSYMSHCETCGTCSDMHEMRAHYPTRLGRTPWPPQSHTRQSPTMFTERAPAYSHPIATVAPISHKYPQWLTHCGQHSFLFIAVAHSFILLSPSLSLSYLPFMQTRAKNKSKHPPKSVMTPTQLAAAGVFVPRPKPIRKPTKDQLIAALEEDLRVTRELLQTVLVPLRCNRIPLNSFFCRIASPS